jgi:hypothetical protein
MRLYSLSASKIKTFKWCQFKFYLESHLSLSTGSSFAAEQGSLIHAVFEKHAKEYKNGNMEPEIGKSWRDKVFLAYKKAGIWKLSEKMKEVEKKCKNCDFYVEGKCLLTNKDIDSFVGCPIEDYKDTISLIETVLNDKSVNNPLTKPIIDVENKFSIEIPDGDEIIKVRGYMDIVTELDKNTIDTFIDKVYAHLGLKKVEHLLDMKCGIVFDKADRKKGIYNLHNHDTGEISKGDT